TIKNKRRALDKPFTARVVSRAPDRWSDRTIVIVDRIERLLDMQRTWLTVRVDAIPIVQPKRGVARLLNFGDQQTCAERVHRAGWQENTIADARLDLVQTQFTRAAIQFARQRRAVKAALQAGINHAPRLSRQHEPSFGLAEVGRVQPSGSIVVGMHLDG